MQVTVSGVKDLFIAKHAIENIGGNIVWHNINDMSVARNPHLFCTLYNYRTCWKSGLRKHYSCKYKFRID